MDPLTGHTAGNSAITTLSSLPLTSLSTIPPHVSHLLPALAAASITTIEELLTSPASDLTRKLSLPPSSPLVPDLVAAVSSAVVATNVVTSSGLGLAQSAGTYTRLSTGDPELDVFLGGGFRPGEVVEVAGESATGKTQLALQAALHVQLPEELGGLDARALYICTEDVFPSARLGQLVEAYGEKYPFTAEAGMGDNLFIEDARDFTQLWTLLTTTVPALLMAHPLRLIVVDSIAGIFRNEYDWNSETIARARDFFKITQQLRWLASTHSVVVLTLNQVSDVIVDDDDDLERMLMAQLKGRITKAGGTQDAIPGNPRARVYPTFPMSSFHHVCPALGLAWTACISTRIVLTRHPGGSDDVHRKLIVEFSPSLPRSEIGFGIGPAGLAATEANPR